MPHHTILHTWLYHINSTGWAYSKAKTRLLRPLACLFACVAATHAQALTVGPLNVRSQLGQTFRGSINITLQAGEQLPANCVRILSNSARADDIPGLLGGRTSLEANANGAQIWITSAQRIDEPALRLRLQIGCDNPVQREYIVLLDPPSDKASAEESSTATLAPTNTTPPGAPLESITNAPTPRPSSRRQPKSNDIPTEKMVAAPAVDQPQDATTPVADSKASRQATKKTSVSPPSEKAISPLLEPGVLPPSKQKILPAPRQSKTKEPLVSGDKLQLLAPDIDGFLPEITRTTGLRLAGTLQLNADGLISPPSLTPEKLEEIRREQRKLAAFLRDEDLLAQSLKNETELKEKIAQLDKQLNDVRTAQATTQSKSGDITALFLFGGAAFLGFGLVIWLLYRLRQAHQHKLSEPWWDAQVTQASTHAPDLDEWQHTGTDARPIIGAFVPPAGPTQGQHVDTNILTLERASQAQQDPVTNSPWSASLPLDIPTHGPLPSFDVSIEELPDSNLNKPGLGSTFNLENATPHAEAIDTHESTPVSPKLDDAWAQADSRLELALDEPLIPVSNAGQTITPLAPDLTLPDGQPELTIPSSLLKNPQPSSALSTAEKTNKAVENLDKLLTLSPYKITLAAVTMAYVDNYSEQRISYAQAKKAQETLSTCAGLLEESEKLTGQGEIDQAISLLRHQVHENKSLPAAPWLALFDLYRQADRQSVYESLMIVFERRFGRSMPDWATYDSQAFQIGLDEMPELMDKIWQHWGTPSGMLFLQSLCDNQQAPDEVFFNRSLARDALNLAKILPLQGEE
ncbi:hypothetical protein [Parvibium lacunae]|uniref:FimV N-terminal domain-containing protein n=1 Tax=Parvibium lacunae TaxID=1888893 RepID=A0A368L818_9BURK|nr:hypothetical protein [Parvibium lacunae]RCS59820.1 hypothetical protein DU000_03725 [Parvibium lacunae]